MMKRVGSFVAAVFCVFLLGASASGQASGDFRSKAAGSWNATGTWETFDGSVWGNAASTPGASNSVYIQAGHTVTLTQNEACNNLNLQFTSGETRLSLGVNALSVNGKLRSYTGALNTIPGASTTSVASSPIIITSGGAGKLSFVGNSRNITNTGEWGAGNTGATTAFAVEIKMTGGQTATMQTPMKASAWNIVSGTLDAGTNTISADNGTTGQGDITIGSGGTLISNQSSNSTLVFQRTGTTRAGTLTVNGSLQLTGASPAMAMNAINFNGTVEYARGSAQTLAVASSATGSVSPSTYTNLRLGGTGAKTLGVNTTVNGTLTLAGTASLASGGFTLTYGASATLEYAGSSAQTTTSTELPAAGGPNSLKINNASGVTLHASRAVNGTLTFVSGNIGTGANTLTLGGAATISRTSGYVIGALQKLALSGAFVFTVGTAGGYTPLDVANAVGGGDLTARTVATVEPHVNASTSLKEYWALTAANSPTVDLTFHYLQADVQGTETNYRIIRVSTVSPFTSVAFPNGCPGSPCVDTTNNTASIKGVSSFSDWTLGEVISPTAVKLGAARAESYAEGVLVSWETGHEVDNLGYNVYRELGGARVRVNRSLIAGSALEIGAGRALGAGEGYQLWDAQGSAAALYWIEDMDLSGQRTMHGPFAPVAGSGDGSRLAVENGQPLLLSELNEKARHGSGVFERGWATAARNLGASASVGPVSSIRAGGSGDATADAARRQREVAGGAALKIVVRRDGWYRVVGAELAAAGLNPDADPRFLQLYADGQQLPMRVNTSPAASGTIDSIEFYGRGLDAPTTDTRIYWLVVGAEPGLRILQTKPAKQLPVGGSKSGNTPSASETDAPDQKSNDATESAHEVSEPFAATKQSFAYTVELKERLIYFSSLLNGDAENYFGQLISSQPVTETLTARHLAATDDAQGAQLEVALQGVSAGSHAVRVFLNDIELDRLTFNATEHAVKVCAVPASLLREGDNAVKLSVDGAAGDVSLVDYLRLTYARTYTADNGSLLLSAPSKGTLRIGGFAAPNIRVVDVTDPESVAELPRTVEPTPTGYAARVQPSGGRTLFAFTDDTATRAAFVTANQPSAWRSDDEGADLLIITHRTLRDSVLPLKALRESEGLRVSVIDVEDLFDEFAYGAHTPQAIKDFLEWTTTHWRRSPHYVLFVGDATVDPRNYEGRGDFDLVPTKLIDTASMETASDEWFADFTNDGVAATMALGRLPVRTPQEASTVIAKIVNFTPDAANKSALFVSDHSGTDDLNFVAASRSVGAQLLPEMTTTFVNRDDGAADAVRSRIVAEINAGPSLVNFMGHGSSTFWTGGQLLRASDAAALSNGNRLPLFAMMTCLSGYFTGTALDSLSEALLKSQRGGAVAVWASSGMTIPVEQQTANQELYRQLFGAGQPPTLGDAVRQAKLATQDQDIRRTWILFGDPSMRWR
ncbi:MAG: C25 family cysteine peptidase [Pyrinomonadaceae bacterium]